MKKLMALCLSVLMVLSMCSFTVMAEGTAVDFSAIANGQPATFVTGNLTLGENVITSSNTDVIALDGAVKRPLFEDATVSLTINGGEAFDVVVKAQTTNILYATDFSTDSGIESQKFTNYSGWSTGTAVKNSTAVTGGKLFADHGITGADEGYLYIYTPTASSSVSTRPVTYTFSISDVANLATGIDIRISGAKYNAEGAKVGEFSSQTIMSMRPGTAGGNKFYGYSVGHTTAKNPATIKYDPTTGELWVNGTVANFSLFDKGTTTEGATVSSVKITNLFFVDAASSAKGQYNIDDFVIYEDVPEREVLQNATPAEKVAYYEKYLEKDYVANGGNLGALTTNLKFTADEELVEGVSIAWTSTNPAIASDGTLKRSITEKQTATITGTLSVEGAESVVKTYNVTILPLTIVGASEIIDFEGIAENTAIETVDGWKSNGSGLTAVTVKEGDGNTYLRVVSDATTAYSSTARQYTFDSVPSVAGAEYIIMEAKVHVPTVWSSINAVNLNLNLNGTKAGEFMFGSAGGPGYIYGGGLLTSNTWHTAAKQIATRTKIPTSDFVDIKIKINPATGVVDYYQSDKRTDTVTYTSGTTYVPNLTELSSASLNIAWRQAIGEIWLDDIKLYTEASEENVLKTLSDSEKVAYFKNKVEGTDLGSVTTVGQELDLDAKYADIDLASYGVTVGWESSNTAYISNDGTVTKLAPHGEAVTVNMTATITAGAASDTVTIPVAIGSETTLIKAVDFSDTSLETGKATYGVDNGEAYGSILTMTNPTEGTHKASGTLTSITGAGRYDRVVFEADMKYTDDGASFASGGICLKTIAGKNGITVYLNYTTNKVQLTTTAAYANGAASGLEATASKTIYYQMPASVLAKGEGAWVHLMVDHNVLSQTYNIYLDGVLVNDVPILQAEMDLGENGGSAIRGYSLELSGKGTVCVDNLELYKYTDANAVEVNAALNAALIQFASDIQSPVLVNQQLPAMTIGRSWVTGSKFNRDLNGSALKPTNVSTYTYVENGPQVTYAIDGQAVTAIDVDSPKVVQLTITASANGVTESKTITRKVAPVAIRSLALGTASCLNGAWIDGADGTEKLIVAKYLDDKFVSAFVVDFAETAEYDSKTGTGDRFDEANSIVNNLGTSHPNEMAEYDQVKIFVVSADGITPLAYANAELHD